MPATRARASAAVLSPWRSRSCFDTWVMIAGLASIGSGMYSPRTSPASSSVADDGAAACSVAGACGSACACWASALRSEERRVGKEWVSTGRDRGSQYHKQKKAERREIKHAYINKQDKNKRK